MGSLDLGPLGGIRLTSVVAHTLGWEVVAHVVGRILIGMFAHAESCNGYPVEGVHVIIGSGRLVGRLLLSSSRGGPRSRTGGSSSTWRRDRHFRARLTQVDVSRELRDFSLRVQQSRLEIDNVLSELIVLRLQSLVIVRDIFELLNSILESSNVRLFALAKCSLFLSAADPKQ